MRDITNPSDELKQSLKDDILFAEMTEEAFSEYRKGFFKREDESAFLDVLAVW